MPGKEWVRESRFGRWFLTTDIWLEYVLRIAVVDLKQLIKTNLTDAPRILDIGCHQGMGFELLEEHFHPRTIIGVDIDGDEIAVALEAAKRCRCHVECRQGTVYHLDLPDNSIDLIFSHQLLHHLSDQTSALDELYRVLVPGGIMLIGESCQSFLNLLWVRLFFRHPKQNQKTANEYVELVKSRGFQIRDKEVQPSIPWWSRKDCGLTERMGWPQKPQEPTEILIIGRKPCETA